MTDGLKKELTKLIESKEFMDELMGKLEAEAAKAVKCFWCHARCDPPYGDGKQCIVCLSRPTSECMSMIVY